MSEEIKEKIYDFLKKNAGEKFSIKSMAKNAKVSYPSALKYVAILLAENNRTPKVRVEFHKPVKLIWVEKDGKTKN